MQRITYTYSSRQGTPGRPPNIIGRIIAGVLSLLALVASAFLGIFIFIAVVGVLLIAGIAVTIRMWLFRRKVEAAFKQRAQQNPQKPDYIDVEFEERG
jgi:flagellar basal body-associated protein FliL